MKKRYIVEFGTGADMHGGDHTTAARRAVKDAVSHCCLCGISEILNKKAGDMHVDVRIGSTQPDAVDTEAVLKEVPFGTRTIGVVPGGLSVRGMEVASLGKGDTIVIAVAALTVSFDL